MKKNVVALFCCAFIFALPCFGREKLKDSLNLNVPESVSYVDFLARLNSIGGVAYEPILFYDSTAFFGLSARLGLQMGLGTTLPLPFFGVRFDVPIVPILVIGKEYGFEIGVGLDFQWWLNKSGLASDNRINTYNSLKLIGVIGYRHYSFGFPHKLFRIGFTPMMQANGRFILSFHISFGI